MTTAAPSAGVAQEDLRGMLLRSPARIAALLHRLRLHHCLLSVRADPADPWRTSLVIAVDPARQRIDLDALHPPPPHSPVAGQWLSVRGRVDGGDLHFSCRCAGGAERDGEPILTAEFPDEVFIRERRGAFRLNLPPQLALPPSALGRSRPEHDAQLLDLSYAGAGALVARTVEPAPGSTVRLRIRLPGTTVDTAAQVRSTARHRDGVRVGLRFDALGADEEGRLTQAINALERQLIRTARERR